MNAHTSIKIAIVIAAALFSGAVHAHGEQTTGTNASLKPVERPWVYVSPAYSQAIYGYPGVSPNVLATGGTLIYADRAHGQAIYSYEGYGYEENGEPVEGGAAGE